MKRWIVLLLCLGCDAGIGPDGDANGDEDDLTCSLPAFASANITLDGEVGDWAGVDPFEVDEQGDDSPDFTGDDLRALYVAQSATHLFMRLDLWENVNTNFGNGPIDEEYGRYALELASDAPIDHMFLGIAFDRDGGVWSLGHNGASAEAPAGLEGPSFVSVAGSVIEFGASLDLIGDPSVFTEVRAESATR